LLKVHVTMLATPAGTRNILCARSSKKHWEGVQSRWRWQSLFHFPFQGRLNHTHRVIMTMEFDHLILYIEITHTLKMSFDWYQKDMLDKTRKIQNSSKIKRPGIQKGKISKTMEFCDRSKKDKKTKYMIISLLSDHPSTSTCP